MRRRRKNNPEDVVYKKVKWHSCTEKAILFELVICYKDGPRDVKNIFAPKSLLKGGALPYWFICRKYQEQVTPEMAGWLVWEDEEKERAAFILPQPPAADQTPEAAVEEQGLFDF